MSNQFVRILTFAVVLCVVASGWAGASPLNSEWSLLHTQSESISFIPEPSYQHQSEEHEETLRSIVAHHNRARTRRQDQHSTHENSHFAGVPHISAVNADDSQYDEALVYLPYRLLTLFLGTTSSFQPLSTTTHSACSLRARPFQPITSSSSSYLHRPYSVIDLFRADSQAALCCLSLVTCNCLLLLSHLPTPSLAITTSLPPSVTVNRSLFHHHNHPLYN